MPFILTCPCSFSLPFSPPAGPQRHVRWIRWKTRRKLLPRPDRISLLSAALAKTTELAPSNVRSVPTCKRARPRALPKALPSTLASSGPVSLTRRRRGRPRPRRHLSRRLPASASRAALKLSSQVLHQLRQGIRPRRAIPHHVYHAAQQCLPLWR